MRSQWVFPEDPRQIQHLQGFLRRQESISQRRVSRRCAYRRSGAPPVGQALRLGSPHPPARPDSVRARPAEHRTTRSRAREQSCRGHSLCSYMFHVELSQHTTMLFHVKQLEHPETAPPFRGSASPRVRYARATSTPAPQRPRAGDRVLPSGGRGEPCEPGGSASPRARYARTTKVPAWNAHEPGTRELCTKQGVHKNPRNVRLRARYARTTAARTNATPAPQCSHARAPPCIARSAVPPKGRTAARRVLGSLLLV